MKYAKHPYWVENLNFWNSRITPIGYYSDFLWLSHYIFFAFCGCLCNNFKYYKKLLRTIVFCWILWHNKRIYDNLLLSVARSLLGKAPRDRLHTGSQTLSLKAAAREYSITICDVFIRDVSCFSLEISHLVSHRDHHTKVTIYNQTKYVIDDTYFGQYLSGWMSILTKKPWKCSKSHLKIDNVLSLFYRGI